MTKLAARMGVAQMSRRGTVEMRTVGLMCSWVLIR
jgi:hypothetical protein